MNTITRRLEFDSGHALLGHEGMCAHLHGHRYVLEITVGPVYGGDLDNVGRVVDFQVIKHALSPVIQTFDHAMILNGADPRYEMLEEHERLVNFGFKNPTAENLALFFFSLACWKFHTPPHGMENKSLDKHTHDWLRHVLVTSARQQKGRLDAWGFASEVDVDNYLSAYPRADDGVGGTMSKGHIIPPASTVSKVVVHETPNCKAEYSA
jgi:6-pyruvoyltetrahydropterin/6-carboxytetrahydropterin synthase